VDIKCTTHDKIRCTRCGQIIEISRLRPENGHKFVKPEKAGTYWQSRYLYCLCGDPEAKVYDPGDGEMIISDLARAELVKA